MSIFKDHRGDTKGVDFQKKRLLSDIETNKYKILT